MRTSFRFIVLLSVSLLLAGCATTEERVSNLENQMQNVQVLDLRLSNAETRLSKVENDVNVLRDNQTASGKPGAGKKTASAKGAKKQPQAAPVLTPPAAPTAPSSVASKSNAPVTSKSNAPVTAQSTLSPPAQILGVPASQRDLGGGRIVQPNPAFKPTPAASPDKPAPALVPVAMDKKAAPVKEPRRPAATPPKTGKGAYDAALALYYSGQYAKAQEQFRDFLSKAPSSSLAPNAMYWQGECQYSLGKLDSAIMTFKDLAGKYPKHPKAAAALLKAGFAYAKLKDMENARFYWQILIDDFPKSEPAAMARKRLAQG